MRIDVLRDHLVCAECRSPALDVRPFERRAEEIVHGVVVCSDCRRWYRIEDGLLELLPGSLQDPGRLSAFARRFRSGWDGWALAAPPPPAPSSDWEHRRAQMSFYNEDALPYEQRMLRLPFWIALDRTFLDEVRAAAGPGAVMLEIGCGTGRTSLPTCGTFRRVLGFDISEAMVRTAMRKRDERSPAPKEIHYFVADAEAIPVRDSTADVAVFSGILHHLESPARAVREAIRSLRPGGSFVGAENNRSVWRPLFDLLMRASRIWNEKAHEDHFIMSREEIGRWLREAGVQGEIWTSVFLPPHLFNLLAPRRAERLLRASDRLCRSLPWLREQGGLVLFSGRKGSSAA
jgi:SAM-dependent methyltransferase/uncharacterized protein YbaR (Trm112 family)